MIKSFKDEETRKIFNGEFSLKLPSDIQATALRKLIMINNAMSLQDLRVPPGNHLEVLHGNREGQVSVRINDKYRICFKYFDNDEYDLEIVDYH